MYLLPKEIIFIFYVASTIYGIICFLMGYFPIKNPSPYFSNNKSLVNKLDPTCINLNLDNTSFNTYNEFNFKHCFVPILYDRVILLIIDALRSDFIFSNILQSENFQNEISSKKIIKMPYLQSLLKENSGVLGYKSCSRPPTVTLPRIKALTTGTIPGFIDVVLNFGTTILKEDNLLHQLKLAKKNINFYGDDTWVKLFPGIFKFKDPVSSFFVSDYTEVDYNVSRHLYEELSKQTDWDVLILHYLGLDHIGHMTGPNGPLIHPKLLEMDSIIKLIKEKLDEEEEKGLSPSTLFVITGDHGMSNQGGHGGSTYEEIMTPLLLIGSKFNKKNLRLSINKKEESGDFDFENPRRNSIGDYDINGSIRVVQQIDIVPTLAILVGVPIPINNMGVIIIEALSSLSLDNKLKAASLNAKQLIGVFKRNNPNYKDLKSYQIYRRTSNLHKEWIRKNIIQSEESNNYSNLTFNKSLEIFGYDILSSYLEVMNILSSDLTSSLTEYDYHAISIGFYFIFCMIWVIILEQNKLYIKETTSNSFVNLIIIFISFAFAFLITGLNALICFNYLGNFTTSSSFLCRNSSTNFILSNIFLFTITLIFFNSIGFFLLRRLSYQDKFKRNHCCSVLEYFLYFGTFFHSLSLMSSSFVEEEHQTWYFLMTTFYLILLINSIIPYYNDSKTCAILRKESISLINYNIYSEVKSKTIYPQNESIVNSENKFDEIEIETQKIHAVLNITHFKDAVMIVIILFLSRFCRAYNRTGNKWIYLSDIGDSLVRYEYIHVLSLITTVSLISILVVYFIKLKTSTNLLIKEIVLTIGLVSIYCHHLNRGLIISPVNITFIGIFIDGIEIDDSKYKSNNSTNSLNLDAHMNRVMESRICLISASIFFIISLINFLQNKFFKKEKTIDISKNRLFNESHNFNKRLQQNNHSNKIENENYLSTALLNLEISFLLIFLIQSKCHNIFLWAVASINSYFLQNILKSHFISKNYNKTKYENIFVLLHLWMGQTFFFYQGNSNNLSTIDIGSGYVGQTEFNQILTGIFLSINTFSGPIFWTIILISNITNMYDQSNSQNNSDSSKFKCCYGILLTRLLVLGPYLILVYLQRYHIFVWTVFSPKLLYEAALMLVLDLMAMLWIVII